MRMTTKQWTIFAASFICLAAAASLLARSLLREHSGADSTRAQAAQGEGPCTSLEPHAASRPRDVLDDAVAEFERRDLYMSRYWAALDLAAAERLQASGARTPVEVEGILSNLPAPRVIQRTVVRLPQEQGSRIERYLLIASSDPEAHSFGAYVAVVANAYSFGWETIGSLKVPDGWNLWGVWLDEKADWLTVAWGNVEGSQASLLRVQSVRIESVWGEEAVFELVNGFPKTTTNGVLIEHSRPGTLAKRGDGTRNDPHIVPPWGFDWEQDSHAYSLIELAGARQVFPPATR